VKSATAKDHQMPLQAILLGSIGTLGETSDLQRRAFNAAFAEAGLDWEWSRREYRELVARPGGRQRIADYARSRGERVDVDRLHRRKTEILHQFLDKVAVPPRPGLRRLIEAATQAGLRLGLVSTTSRQTVERMLAATGLDATAFAFVGDATTVEAAKPAPDIYEAALEALGIPASDALAIEDSPESAEAAIAAGIRCIAFPGAAHAGREFGDVSGTANTLGDDIFDRRETAFAARA
jgi:HAD superfamily hydrolase (TIGR01509 family)